MIFYHLYYVLFELQYMIAAVHCYVVYFTAYASCCSLSYSLCYMPASIWFNTHVDQWFCLQPTGRGINNQKFRMRM